MYVEESQRKNAKKATMMNIDGETVPEAIIVDSIQAVTPSTPTYK